MLKGIDPLLNAEVLYALRAMGHGDDLVIADAHFPAETMAERLVRMDGVDAPTMLRAVLTVLPIDDFVDEPVCRIEVVGDPDSVPDVCADMERVIAEVAGPATRLAKIDRFEFYDRSQRAFAVIATGEKRLYGCVLIKKGVIRPSGHS